MKKANNPELDEIRNEIRRLEQRLNQIEESLAIGDGKAIQSSQLQNTDEETWEITAPFKSEDTVEFRMGEYGLAWIGNIVLLFGIAFLIQYLKNPLSSAVVGYLCVGIIYAAAHFSQKSFSRLSKLFSYNSGILLFYVTLRLHFFVSNPLIASKGVALVLLLVVDGILLYQSCKTQWPTKSAIAILFLLFTGAVGDWLPFAALITAISSAITLFLFYRYGWIKLLFGFIFIIYLFHINWLINNPMIGNIPNLESGPGLSYLGFLSTAIFFSLVAIIQSKEPLSKEFLIATIVWNGFLFSIVLVITTLNYFRQSYITLFSFISVTCLLYAVLLQKRSDIKLTAAMYALYGFLAMSVAFYGIFSLPKAYALLSLQSLLVVSMALWFRSRFIVVMNSLLYALLLVLYLSDTTSLTGSNFSFMGVAFLSARIMNWQKERLELRTEFIRNVYLAIGFMMTLITFHQAFPENWITASWILAAVLFFVTSLLLKNIKYRWLAIASVIASAIKLIFVDMANIDIGYRILLFMILAVVSISASIAYTKYYKERKNQ